MICIKDDCNKPASATMAEDVLDVTATDNKWVTEEPTFKKANIAYCKEHFQEMMDVLANSRAIKE
ncbi:hypothetical protein CXP39_02860 [Mesoplasma syrphidae]|uniref:Uncharacterized protein n=1 Tax=Mesoplasma syrphidae TaxID=225999 RepID=A0A2K9C9N0_9MOLU|nr:MULTISPECIES: hypothetical protein [Mesoplasma]AUF83725.1 hypothetical protein CXP39_02860 [Mesoplasma syrphidae]